MSSPYSRVCLRFTPRRMDLEAWQHLLGCCRCKCFEWVPFLVPPSTMSAVNNKIRVLFVAVSDMFYQWLVVIASEITKNTHMNRNVLLLIHRIHEVLLFPSVLEQYLKNDFHTVHSCAYIVNCSTYAYRAATSLVVTIYYLYIWRWCIAINNTQSYAHRSCIFVLT